MRTSDYATRPADVAFKPAGPGVYMTFRCTNCAKVGPVLGRARRKVRGYISPQYVCKACGMK